MSPQRRRRALRIHAIPWCRLLAVVALGGAALATACGVAESPPPDAIARLGDIYVRTAVFDRYLERTVGADAEGLSSGVLSKLLDRFLDESVLTRLAEDRQLIGPGDSHRRAADQLLRTTNLPEPSPEEIEAYYHDHPRDFERPERVRLHQVLVRERGTAELALKEIRRGEDFADVVRRYSQDPSAERGGDQGELAREDLPPALAESIFALSSGQVSGIVEADYGFHIFKVAERLPAEVVPLEDAAEEIRLRLHREAADRLLEELVEEARSLYNVTVYQRNLRFNYEGIYRAEDL